MASGRGTNAEALIRYFRERDEGIVVCGVVTDREAPVEERAHRLGVASVRLSPQQKEDGEALLSLLAEQLKADFILLAGYLRLVPPQVVRHYWKRILNIHPSVIPHYSGRGWWGERIFRAILEDRFPLAGITVHFADEEYDHGEIVFQCAISTAGVATAEELAQKVHALEHFYYPRIAHLVIRSTFR